MKKYISRYLFLWLPAITLAYIFTVLNSPHSALSQSMPAQLAQWLCVIIMLIGWSANTGMSAYYYPRNTFSLLLTYYSICLILVTLFYRERFDSSIKVYLDIAAGLFSYKPLDILERTLIDFNMQHRLVILHIIVACNFIGYIIGVIARIMNPNPYRPKLYKWR